MSRINSNIPSLIAQRILTGQNAQLNLTLQRLSTGLRINTGKDDPAGLIASETMRAEMRAIQAAQSNVSRAMNVVSVAESGLNEISNLLNDLEDLVDRSANESGISDEERMANQLEIDMILSSINRIANSTELQGRKLLSGDLQYTTSNVDYAQIEDLQLHSVNVPEGDYTNITIDVITSGFYGYVVYSGGGALASGNTIEVAGNLGSVRIALASGATTTDIANAVNMNRDATGVSAVLSNAGADVYFTSIEYGGRQFVRVKQLTGTQITANMASTEDYGQDVVAAVNGMQFTGDGLRLDVRSDTLDVTLQLAAAYGSTPGTQSVFQVKGGGAKFAVAPKLDLNGLATLGIDPLTTASLGKKGAELYLLGSGEQFDLNSKSYGQAQKIVRTAAQEVATLRGRLGSFHKNTLETTQNSLMVQFENVASAESTLRDADFASETSNLTRAQILVQSANNVLRIANAAPQNVLALLG